MSANASAGSQAAAAAQAPRKSAAPRRHGGQRHQITFAGSTADRLLLEEARSMLADGVCDIPVQQVPVPVKGSPSGPTPNWSPASTVSTDAPSMTPLELPVAAVDLEWPSVHKAGRETEHGWEFCSQASDEESSWVEELDSRLAPEPEGFSAAVDDAAAWLVTSGVAPELPEDPVPKRTFAEALLASRQGTGAAAVVAGCRMPVGSGPGKEKPCRSSEVADGEEDGTVEDYNPHTSSHGWKKQHKATRNSRQSRKLSQQIQRRTEQSIRTRGWSNDNEEDEE